MFKLWPKKQPISAQKRLATVVALRVEEDLSPRKPTLDGYQVEEQVPEDVASIVKTFARSAR